MLQKHPTAIVQTDRIGDRTRVWAFVNICPEAVIGSDCNICDRVFIENKVRIGDRVTIKCGVSLWDGVTVEDDVFIGPGAAFTNDLRPRSRVPFTLLPTVVRVGASVGANATLLPGITIGRYAMVAAGTVVTKDVPDFALVIGNPARVRGWVCRCATKLSFEETNHDTCKCGRAYRLAGGNVEETTIDR